MPFGVMKQLCAFVGGAHREGRGGDTNERRRGHQTDWGKEVFTTMPPVDVASVRAAEERLRSDRRHANELIELLAVVEECSAVAQAPLRLAAVQACRALFELWLMTGELVLQQSQPGGDDEDEDKDGTAAVAAKPSADDALAAYRAWLLRAYHRFVAALRMMLSASKTPLAMRVTSLDSLMLLASLEARHARSGGTAPRPDALDAASGAFRHAIDALAGAKKPLSDALQDRLREAHLAHLDARFYLWRHVRRLASDAVSAASPPPSHPAVAERLLELLLLASPPSADVPAGGADLLCVGASAAAGSAKDAGAKKRKRGDTAAPAGGGGASMGIGL